MGVFTFVLRKSGDEWKAKQFSGDIEDSSPSTFEIQRKLVKAVLATDSSGAVRTSYSLVSPSSAVFQVIVGGAVLVSVAAAPAGVAAPAEVAPAAEKKEEKVEEEEEDDDLGLSLFD